MEDISEKLALFLCQWHFLRNAQNSIYNWSDVKENAEALVVATKEIGLEVNADKTKYSDTSANEDNSFWNHIR